MIGLGWQGVFPRNHSGRIASPPVRPRRAFGACPEPVQSERAAVL